MNVEVSWEEAVRRLQADPTRAELVRESYYDSDVWAAARRFDAGEEWTATRGLLPTTPGIAVDLGAGRGMATYALASAGWSVVAVEPDPGDLVGRGALASLRAASGRDFQVNDGTAERTGLADRSADLVYARAVLHHTNDLSGACREIARILKPGGMFLAVREHVVDRPEDETVFLSAHALHALYGGEHALPLAVYTEAIERSGLRLARVLGSYDSPINFAPYTIHDIWGLCAKPLIAAIGWRLAGRLAGPSSWLGRRLMRSRGRRLSALDRRPGRLCSFVAIKE